MTDHSSGNADLCSTGMALISRRVAVVGLLGSAAFFGWWGLAIAPGRPQMMPLFGGLVLAWVLSAVGVHRERSWGPGFAAGLTVLGTITMLPVGLHPAVALFLGAQVVVTNALIFRALAADRPEGDAWRHGALAFGAGLAAPWLLVAGLRPSPDCLSSVLGLLGLAAAGHGIAAAFRGRTWGLFSIALAIPLLIAIPSLGVGADFHDTAGELAAIALGAALLPWLVPVVRFLRRG